MAAEEREEGCWAAWFDGLAEAIRRGPPTRQPFPVYYGHSERVEAPRNDGPIASLVYEPSGSLWYDDE